MLSADLAYDVECVPCGLCVVLPVADSVEPHTTPTIDFQCGVTGVSERAASVSKDRCCGRSCDGHCVFLPQRGLCEALVCWLRSGPLRE